MSTHKLSGGASNDYAQHIFFLEKKIFIWTCLLPRVMQTMAFSLYSMDRKMEKNGHYVHRDVNMQYKRLNKNN